MREYRLESAVPVEWLDFLDDVHLAYKSLKAGTLLDERPLVVGELASLTQGFVKVRVDGHDGLVHKERLQEALPGWA